eukprot:CAMPEP_0117673728 /NCGR_PEP_ID=MMETSP0804-20121206/14633_1 /TAXON_ID=1074897 /ORGANISM="Tetraselmis astigmatica, Strain CCMP880" /LENGTH=1232 /DNA_ID=CAMNT_0005482497 /DNA_START=17 /DNA_END=3715 /DNA_ORIENTATION=-
MDFCHTRRRAFRCASAAGPLAEPAHARCHVPGCPNPGFSGVKKKHPPFCRMHLTSASFQLDGVTVCFCMACKRVHALEHFSTGKNFCSVAERRLLRSLQALYKLRAKAESEAAQQWGLASTAWSRLKVYLPSSKETSDPGRRVWAGGIVSCLRAETPAARLAITALYSTAAFLLDWHQPGTWVTVPSCCAILHLVVPFIHRHCYVTALERCRQAAEQCGLVVTSAFRLLDPHEDAKYECSKNEKYDVSDSVALFTYTTFWFLQISGASYKAWGTSPETAISVLLLAGALFFPLEERARKAGHHGLRNSLECGLLFLGQVASSVPSIYAWATGDKKCPLPEVVCTHGELQTVCLLSLFDLIDMAVRAAVINLPLSVSVGMAYLRWSYYIAMTPIFYWCIGVECGATFPHSIVLQQALLRFVTLLVEMVYRVHCKKLKLLRYIAASRQKAESQEPTASDYDYPFGHLPHFRTAIKLRGVTPAHLRPDLRDRLASVMQVEPEAITGVMRPGCVLLGLTVRPGSWGRMRMTWASMLANDTWGETLLQPAAPVDISLSHQGATYQVRDGRLDFTALRTDVPSIELVSPVVATLNQGTLALRVGNLDGSSFKVLLRTVKEYYELEMLLEERTRPGEATSVGVRLPEDTQPGVGWLEVMVDTEDSSLVLSEPSPVMFSPLKEVAEEVNLMLQTNHATNASRLGTFLEDISDCLHQGRGAPPHLLLNVIRLGLTKCLSRLATRSLLKAADRVGQGVLGAAAQSDSEEMVQEVIQILRHHGLPVDPCKPAVDAVGYTALHWAAHVGNLAGIYLLLAETPRPWESWACLMSRKDRKTPAQVSEEKGGEFFLDEAVLEGVLAARDADHQSEVGDDWNENEYCGHSSSSWEPSSGISCGRTEPLLGNESVTGASGQGEPTVNLGHHEEEPGAILGRELVTALRGGTITLRASFTAFYLAACIQLGWREPLTWWTLAVLATTLHLLLPYVHEEVYVKGLDEVRGLATCCDLQVSQYFCLAGSPLARQMYEQHVSKRAAAVIMMKALLVLIQMWMTTTPLGELLAVLFSSSWRYAPLAVGCAIMAVRTWATLAHRYRLWQRLGTTVDYYCLLAFYLPVAHIAVTCRPSTLDSFPPNKGMLRDNPSMGVGLCVGSMAAWGAFFCSAQKQPVGGRLMVVSELSFLAVYAFLLAPIHAHVISEVHPRFAIFVISAFTAHRLFLFGFRLQSEKNDLCAFLRSRQRPSKAS